MLDLPLSTEVARVIAEDHGSCIRPLAMRRIDTTPVGSMLSRSPVDPPGKINAARARKG